MTNEEIVALRQRARNWRAEVGSAPANLLALHERLVEACLETDGVRPGIDDIMQPTLQ